ncbi:MAG: hypothetical protein LUE24_13865 [Lachnospiraceae bacterium]|nr:hypothetical protein [Lachnospiraceae bacterium]
MSEERYVSFRHGALCPSYEEQANEQGLTLGDEANYFDKIADAYNLLRMEGLLTDSQEAMICQKIQKKLAASVKLMEESGEDVH